VGRVLLIAMLELLFDFEVNFWIPIVCVRLVAVLVVMLEFSPAGAIDASAVSTLLLVVIPELLLGTAIHVGFVVVSVL